MDSAEFSLFWGQLCLLFEKIKPQKWTALANVKRTNNKQMSAQYQCTNCSKVVFISVWKHNPNKSAKVNKTEGWMTVAVINSHTLCRKEIYHLWINKDSWVSLIHSLMGIANCGNTSTTHRKLLGTHIIQHIMIFIKVWKMDVFSLARSLTGNKILYLYRNSSQCFCLVFQARTQRSQNIGL